MGTYILTLVIVFGSGATSVSIEYNSLDACEKAKESHIKSLNYTGLVRVAVCTKK